MLITGGYDEDDRLSSVEIFDPSNPSFSCQLSNMTVARAGHAAVGTTVCGGWGYDSIQTCETLNDGQWQVSHSLQEKRVDHVMWQSPSEGVILMSGTWGGTRNTTERLDGNGTGWGLQHNT